MAFITTTPLLRRNRCAPVRCTNLRARPRTACRPIVCKAREVTAEELERVLEANERPVLVDVFAEWCGPCQYMVPQLDILASKLGHKMDVLKLDSEKFPDLASALLVRGLPTLFFIKEGKLKHRMEGALNADDLEKLVNYVLFDGPPPQSPRDGPPQQRSRDA